MSIPGSPWWIAEQAGAGHIADNGFWHHGSRKEHCDRCSPSERPRFVCPVCRRATYHPQDVKEGYCSHCHDWTRKGPA